MSVWSRAAVALAVGIAIGAGAAFGTGEPAAQTPPTTMATTGAPTAIPVEAPWVEGGVRFRSSVLVPLSFVVDAGRAEIEFEVVPLHWTVGEETTAEEIPVQPERWVLTTATGSTSTSATVLGDDVVRWEVPGDLTLDDVSSVTVVGWRIAMPVGETVTVPLESGASATFSDGTEIEIDAVLEQLSSTIVQINSRLPDDPWHHGSSLAVVDVRDPGWRVGFRFNQSSNVQLIWAGSGAPNEVELEQEYPMWIPIAAETAVIGEGP
jgi:hypothetical protein